MAGDEEGQTTVGVSPLAVSLYAVELLLLTALLRMVRLHYIPLIRQWCTILLGKSVEVHAGSVYKERSRRH